MTRKELIEKLLEDGNDNTPVVDRYDGDDTEFDEVVFDDEQGVIALVIS